APACDLVRHPRVRALRPEVRAVAPLPRPVGELRERGPSDAAGRRARLALALEPADRALVRFLATNAACPALLLPAVLGIGWRDARRRLARLEEDGLVRAIGVTEVGSAARRARLLELTVDGLALAAADLGPTAELAWRAHGLSGGGPDAPVGLRGRWLAQLGHTLAVRGFAAA